MYLKAIELHGFKSFPEKTKIEFEKGMSVVVGPNGSGKSNISDAIRWVLGETRSSRLRGSGKMEDIIFGGTQKRSPMGFASVSLILDNTERVFDVDNDEVAVMRKYYRGGDSEYYINGARVRLRDIQELFMDTGLGKNGYSIVGQGKVNEIVTSKPEGRREIFEEASGIAKFRYKKNEAEKKLEAAEGNINRITDIISTLEDRVGPLERESIKAKDFLNLSYRKKELEISLWLDTVEKSKELIRTQQRRLEIFNRDLAAVEEKLDNSEKYLEERYLYANSLVAKSEDNINDIRAFEGEISRLNNQKAYLESGRVFSENRIESLQKELAGFENESRSGEEEIRNLKEKIKNINRDIDCHLQRQSSLQMKLDQLIKTARENGDERGKINGEINSLNIKLQEEKIEAGTLTSRKERAEESLATAVENLEKAREFAMQSKAQAEEIKEFIELCEDNITKTNNIRNGLIMKRNSALGRLETANAQSEQNVARQVQTADRIKWLTDMENSMEGYNGAVKTVINRAKSGGLGGILGSVAQIISVEKGYETAVEIAMGFRLQNIVAESEANAKQAIEYLKSTKGGRATFLPLDTIKPAVFNERLPDWARTADSVITADDKFKNIISYLMGRTIIVEDLNSATNLARRLNYRYPIVTLDGQQVNAGGSMTGGSVSKSTGLFTRRTERENLKIRLENLKEERLELEKNKLSAQNTVDNINSSIEGCDGEISRITSEKNDAEIEYARVRRTCTGYENSAEGLENEITNLKNSISAIIARKNELEQLVKANESEVVRLQFALDSLGAKDEESLKEQNSVSEEIQTIRLTVTESKGILLLEENNLKQMETNLENRETRKEEILTNIKSLTEENNARNRQIKEFDSKIVSLGFAIEEKEKENASFVKIRLDIDRERTQLTADNKSLSDEKARLSAEAAKVEERIYSMEGEYDTIIAKLWEEYELTVHTAAEFRVDIEDEGAMKRELNGIKNAIKRLGNVNVGAIEEYKEVSERYKYMKTQLADLQESKNRMVKLITSLNGEMKTIFTASFKSINENFGRIFTELFGGGSARLELVDKEDVLSSGIEIIVSPPGKVIKSLTALSGGEQALVAIAIYFAILAHNPSPFCVLDEIEAALDDVNVARYANYLHRICDKTQFIVISHRRGTMDAADVLYGVTMQEDGISKMLKLDVNNLSAAILN